MQIQGSRFSLQISGLFSADPQQLQSLQQMGLLMLTPADNKNSI